MLSELSRKRTIFRRATSEDKNEVLKHWCSSSRFTFDECLDQEKFLFLVEQAWWNRRTYTLQGYVVAHKCERNAIAEILHWGFEYEDHSLQSMWITTLEQLYAEGIDKIDSPAAVALALPIQRTLPTQDIAFLLHENTLLTLHKMVQHLEFSRLPVDLVQLILSFCFFPRNTCRVKRGESSWEERTDDIVWAVAEILGWNDETLSETVYLVRHYTHYNAYHLTSCENCVKFSPTLTSGFSIMRLSDLEEVEFQSQWLEDEDHLHST